MKIIGKNSLSQYISYFLKFLFLLFAAIFIYQLIGFAVSWYNLKTGKKLLWDLYIIGNDVGWAQSQWTNPVNDLLKFKFFIPFTGENLLTGLFTPGFVYFKIFSGLFLTLFFFFSAKIFQEFTTEKAFTPKTLKLLRAFSLLNIIYFPLLASFYFSQKNNVWEAVFHSFYEAAPFLFLGILILFAIEFFKKGYELQSENDLTI